MARLLDIPWEESRYLKKKYSLRPRGGSLFYYSGANLPTDLRPYVTEDFSFARWVEDDEQLKQGSKRIPIQKPKATFKPYDHQKVGAKKIVDSELACYRGFLLADRTGIGKTLTATVAVAALAKHYGANADNQAKVLVVCPKGVIGVWRQTLRNYLPARILMRVLVINYQQLNKLLEVPESASKAKTKRTKNRRTATGGKPTVDWDYIIFDESHYLKNYPSSAMSLAAASVAKLETEHKRGITPFVIYSTATPGASPLNFAVMAGWLAPLIKPRSKATPKSWGDFLANAGFAVTKGKSGYSWATTPWYGAKSTDPKEQAKHQAAVSAAKGAQRADARRIGAALKKEGAPFIMRSPKDIVGWPEQQFIALPIEMEIEQRKVYDAAWTAFRRWLRLPSTAKDPQSGLVQRLRYRQKASLLKIPALVDLIEDFVKEDKQVYVSCEFLESLDTFKELLAKKKIAVAEISGRNVEDRENERIRFQRGEAKVVLCTVVAGISLHAGETLPDGSKATLSDRITIVGDIRQNTLDAVQGLGRAHRDGRASVTYIPFLDETVDEKVVGSFVNNLANMKTMTGESQQDAEELERIFEEAAK